MVRRRTKHSKKKETVSLEPKYENSFLKNLNRIAEDQSPVVTVTPMKKLPVHVPPAISKKEFNRKRALF